MSQAWCMGILDYSRHVALMLGAGAVCMIGCASSSTVGKTTIVGVGHRGNAIRSYAGAINLRQNDVVGFRRVPDSLSKVISVGPFNPNVETCEGKPQVWNHGEKSPVYIRTVASSTMSVQSTVYLVANPSLIGRSLEEIITGHKKMCLIHYGGFKSPSSVAGTPRFNEIFGSQHGKRVGESTTSTETSQPLVDGSKTTIRRVTVRDQVVDEIETGAHISIMAAGNYNTNYYKTVSIFGRGRFVVVLTCIGVPRSVTQTMQNRWIAILSNRAAKL